MIKIVIECEASGESIIANHMDDVLRAAGVRIAASEITHMNLRTRQGTLAYMLDPDGLNGPEHVLKWVDNHERLTGELKAVHPVAHGPGWTVHTSRKPAVVADHQDFQESEL